jgi:hypothetical protein
MTNTFTKYAEICAIPNKEASTVAREFFEKWIYRFGCDNGKEFCNELTKELFTLLQIKHSHTTPHHPQCNAQAEVQIKVIQKYLAAFVDKTTLNGLCTWPPWLLRTTLHFIIQSNRPHFF